MAAVRSICIWILWASVPIFLIVLTIHSSDGATTTEHAYVDYVLCQWNPKFTRNTSCKLKFINRLTKSFTTTCFVTETVDNVIGYTQLYHRFRGGYKLFLVNVNVNVCDYIKGKIGSTIIDLALPKIRKYLITSQNLTCPYYGRLDIKELPLTGALVANQFLPVGNYMINITATTNKKELIWNAKFYFIIPEGTTIEDDQMGR